MQASETTKCADLSFQPIIEKCEGCERIVEEGSVKYCKTYKNPEAKWHLGLCNFATHAKPELNLVKVRVNPLKASKRASRRK
ncbi:MAG TPA: hypothetical protein ENO11_02255 [Desulfobacteraceae bacterium]|nr:hypothetical protein [Desulfobacteraceae bacterium]